MIEDKKLDVGLISAYDGIRWGLKPSEKPVLEFFRQYSGKYSVLDNALNGLKANICVIGDRFIDLKLGYNLKKALKSNYNSKVRVDKVLVNRYGNNHACCDFLAKNLMDLKKIVKSENYDIIILDVDNTIVKSYVPKESGNVSDKSNFDRFGNNFFVRAGFLLFTISDEFLSFIGMHPRRPYLESEGSLDCVLDAAKKANSFIIFDSSTNPFDIKKLLTKKSKYEFNFLYNKFL